jgi:hypothetical protein
MTSKDPLTFSSVAEAVEARPKVMAASRATSAKRFMFFLHLLKK